MPQKADALDTSEIIRAVASQSVRRFFMTLLPIDLKESEFVNIIQLKSSWDLFAPGQQTHWMTQGRRSRRGSSGQGVQLPNRAAVGLAQNIDHLQLGESPSQWPHGAVKVRLGSVSLHRFVSLSHRCATRSKVALEETVAVIEENEVELIENTLKIGGFLAVTLGIVVLFVGKRLNDAIGFLREFSIPEPVTGGLLFSILFGLVYAVSGVAVEFDLGARDFLLVYFFTTIGINASLKDLVAGGKPLIILLTITIGYMVLQNLTGISVAALFDLPGAVGLLGGTVSLIGGHGTAIAWAPRISEDFGVQNAMEIGIACATFGLILASLMGGPIAKVLITRYDLKPTAPGAQDVGVSDQQKKEGIGHLDFLDAILAIHISAVLGFLFQEGLEELGLKLPLFVTCLFAGILLTNLIPKNYPRISGTAWPTRTPAIALIADVSLGTFLAMSLMSMQLWTLIDLAGPIFTILAAQFVVAVAVNLFVVFPAMGRNYDAAVVSAGFGGISLGATPTAMANMAAVTHRYGASHLAFIVVPLVCAFFIDLVNAVLIPFFLTNF
ncbi:MAG: sodium/glutamate symporter [Sedimenticolaceae bacterium]